MDKKPGRRARNRSAFSLVIKEAPGGICENCHRSPLTIQEHRVRLLQLLTGKLLLTHKDRRCSNLESCPNFIRASASEARLIVPRCEYGLDVIALIGERTIQHHKSFREIHRELISEYGLAISERHVPNLFRLYIAIVGARTVKSRAVQSRLEAQGRVILSFDAVKFDDVSPRLYVVRDVLSEEILAAERIEKADTESLTVFLKKVSSLLISLAIPVAGCVSDKEQALIAACKAAFPGVPHQFCQTHYLGHVVEPMKSDLAQLGPAVEKTTSAVRDLISKLDKLKAGSPQERELTKKLCEATRVMSKKRGDNILDPPALKRFNALCEIESLAKDAMIKKVDGQPKPWPLLTYLLVVLKHLAGFKELANRLSDQMKVVHEIAHILNLELSADEVKSQLKTYFKTLEEAVASGAVVKAQASFYEQVIAVTYRYWDGLFACYDVSGLPKNNNALESFFRALKWHMRKVQGKKSTAGGPLDSFGPLLVLLWPELNKQPQLQVLFDDLTPEEIQLARQKIQELAEPSRARRSFIRNVDVQLKSLLANWHSG